ncbi:hypothetical protein Pelo_2954 [Pelomyxa schiedti]|nr:hypothetical protein Pelo_2954 [Pelomyxa schiedti]
MKLLTGAALRLQRQYDKGKKAPAVQRTTSRGVGVARTQTATTTTTSYTNHLHEPHSQQERTWNQANSAMHGKHGPPRKLRTKIQVLSQLSSNLYNFSCGLSVNGALEVIKRSENIMKYWNFQYYSKAEGLVSLFISPIMLKRSEEISLPPIYFVTSHPQIVLFLPSQ